MVEARERLASITNDVGPVSEPLEQAKRDLLVDRVILGEKDAQRHRRAHIARHRRNRAGRRVASVAERLEQPIAQMREPQGLRQPRGKAGVGVGRRQRLAGRRQKDENRRVCAPRGANFSGQRDSVHLGHLVIEKCHVEGIALYDPFERHGGRVCIPGAHAPSLGLELKQKTIAGIVVDDQNALACQLRLLTVGGRTL